MIYLKQNTAVTLKIGPFLDDIDWKTPETELTIARADIRLSKNGSDIAQKNEATSCIHDELGIYGCPIDATDTNTLGRLQLWVHESGALPIQHEFTVVTENAYDSMFSTDNTIADQVWDEVLTGATHNIATSAGRRLREIAAYAIHHGIAQAGTAITVTLAASASCCDGGFNRNLIVIVDGTGQGQTRTIVDYNNTSKICIVDREWRTNPDDTSEYQILADDTPLVVDHGVAQAGTATTIKLREYASSIDDTYLCNIITIIGGAGRGQARLVGGYNGTSKVVTLCGDNWVTSPDDTSVYVMVPYGTTCTSCVGTSALSQIADATLDEVVEGSTTFRQMLRIFMSVFGGKSSGGGTTTLTFRDLADGKDRITATVDVNGNRTTMVLDGA